MMLKLNNIKYKKNAFKFKYEIIIILFHRKIKKNMIIIYNKNGDERNCSIRIRFKSN